MIEDWLEQNIDGELKYTGSGKEIHFNCPVCGETRKRMYVNRNIYKVFCHNCGFSSNIVGLIQYIEGVSWYKAYKDFEEIKGNFVLPESLTDELDSIMMELDDSYYTKRAIPLPEEYKQIDVNTKNLFVKRAIKYLNKRGITNRQIQQHKFGYCMDGVYKDRIIIPITENGDLKFWVARASNNTAKLKEKSPSDEDWNISKSEVVFNIDVAAKKYHACVICEGIFDALSFGDIGVSLLGKRLYKEQLSIILGYRTLLTNGVYIAIDWDARSYATEMAQELSQYFDVYIINIPKEDDDPNNYLRKYGRDAMWTLIQEAEPYGEFTGLRRLLT